MASLFRPFPGRALRFTRKPSYLGTRLYSTPSARTPKPGLSTLRLMAGIGCGLAVGLGVSQYLREKAVAADIPSKPVFAARTGVVSTDPDDLQIHGLSTHTYHTGVSHSVVVYPESTEDVVQIVKIAIKYKMPITGQFIGRPGGGICVDMTSMNKILEIHEADADVVCQPGLGWMELNETLKERGIDIDNHFVIDPAPDATIGGMASTGCSGTNAVRYGTAKAEWFLNLTVVLPNGEVIKTRRRSRKSSAGFDMTKLFIGAEGTLGIITEVTIRLAPLLPTTVASVQFPNVKAAVEASIEILRSGIASGIQCVELVDDSFLAATNKHSASSHKYSESDGLFFKFQGGTPGALAETAQMTRAICTAHGGTDFRLAKDAEEAADIWADRKNAHFAGMALVPGARALATDVCVPVSQLPKLVLDTKADLKANGIVHLIVGHVGDGNFHALLLFSDEEEHARAQEAAHRMIERAIALDGTCTGEHGVGVGKREYLAIKRTIDPLGLFNPGKLYPDDEDPELARGHA
ncbi:FAD-linked oxidase-like protein [Mycena pura]|uniref:D-lactate dehydrogenase (cytochrome) n=1 Tax=Mycena pura TaxID=153505 RepID=A0AAD7E5P1_9AGAR|nr:FAD-linked oxidase-like protein [Mycena pura]